MLKTLLTLVLSVVSGDSVLNVTRLLGLLMAALTGLTNELLHSLALSLQTGSIFFFMLINQADGWLLWSLSV